ncbi:hypothetical protein CPC08DRAFT_381138 [Agrocybe pediades]|nr:hypothetical protein CPC08DRAFT_381138 [Agrocybe pediades]
MANQSKPSQRPSSKHVHGAGLSKKTPGASTQRLYEDDEDRPSRGEYYHDREEEMGRAKRTRVPSSKVQQQRDFEVEEKQRKAEQAARRALRQQRDAPETDDEADNFHDDKGDDNMFSSRTVPTRVSKHASRARAIVESDGDEDESSADHHAPLVRKDGRLPARQAVSDQLESDIEEHQAERTLSKSNPDSSGRLSPVDNIDVSSLSSSSRKCGRSSSLESLREVKVSKSTTTSRPKASDYDDTIKEAILQAIEEYRCQISAVFPFPDHPTETQLARKAWKGACSELGSNITLTPAVAKLITTRGSHTRGELKTKARPIVETFYKFESGHNKKTIAKNRELAESLKDEMGYAYEVHHADPAQRKGLYRNPLIQKIVNAMWFRNRQDIGVTYDSFFSPFRHETIALVLTVIECCIDEWVTGIRTDCAFTSSVYRTVYEDHIKCIRDFIAFTEEKPASRGLVPNICEKLYNRGRFHAGAQPVSKAAARLIPNSAFAAAVEEYTNDSSTETDGEDGLAA